MMNVWKKVKVDLHLMWQDVSHWWSEYPMGVLAVVGGVLLLLNMMVLTCR